MEAVIVLNLTYNLQHRIISIIMLLWQSLVYSVINLDNSLSLISMTHADSKVMKLSYHQSASTVLLYVSYMF